MNRKGFLTPEQEGWLDELIKLKGVAEMADGTVIKLADNKLGEALKTRIASKWGDEVLEDVYEVVDMIFEGLSMLTDKE